MPTPAPLSIDERIAVVRWALARVDRATHPQDWRKLWGILGGLTTLQRHGPRHFVSAGRIGFMETVRRHWQGDRAAYTAYLRERGLLMTCDREFGAMLDLYREYRPDLFLEETPRMQAVDLPPITQADIELERARLQDDTPAPAFPRLILEAEVLYAGRRWRVRFADTPIDQAAAILDKKDCQDASAPTAPAHPPTGNWATPATTDQPPLCPTHAGRTMTPMQRPDAQGHQWMCTAKVGDGWCAERA